MLAHIDEAPSTGGDRPIRLIADGVDLTAELTDVAASVRDAVDTFDAVVDGVVTRQVGLRGVGAASIVEVRSSATGMLMRNSADIDVRPRGVEIEPEADEGFVAVDLLAIDGTDLLDVPLLERKRVLDSIVPPDQLIRAGPYVREPLGSWIDSWRAQGFRAMTFKSANSRYRPGETSAEWTLADMPRR